ncbi:MAG: DedA family protein, partial [Cyanobacteria bacterium J06635_10]
NFLGAGAWAGAMVSLAFFAGKVVSLEQLVQWVSKFTILALLALVALIAVPLWLESRQVEEQSAEE